ncbi:MAG: M48 family metalloprotease [Hydrogenophilus sp.]|nr:M48 family metalloprotease [Hydrogenophilus sp.]
MDGCNGRRRGMVGLMGWLVTTQGWGWELPDLGAAGAAVLSQREEERWGRRLMVTLREREPGFWDEPGVQEYVTLLARRVAEGLRALGRSVPQVEGFVLRDDSINAVALPGGFLGVHTGLIATTEDEGELAAVVAHEVAHVAQRHLAQMAEAQRGEMWLILGSLVVAAAAARGGGRAGALPEAVVAAGEAAALERRLVFSRAFEQDADRLGLELLVQAGFEGEAAVRFFERLWRASRLGERGALPYLRTHPLSGERLSDLAARLPAYRGRGGTRFLDGEGFGWVRGRILAERGGMAPQTSAEEEWVRGAWEVWRRVQEGKGGEAVAAAERLQGWREGRWRTLLWAEALTAAGRRGEALQRLAEGLRREPDSLALRAAAVRSGIGNRALSEAWQWAQEGVARAPRSDLAWRLVGEVAAARGDEGWSHRAQGERAMLAGRWQEAITQFEWAQRARGEDEFWGLEVQARINTARAEWRAEQGERRW